MMFDHIKFGPSDLDESGEFIPLFSLEDEGPDANETFNKQMPLLALKNTVLFPGVVIPITVGRDKSMAAIRHAEKHGKNLIVVTQKDMTVEEPAPEDLFRTGTVARVMKVLKMPDGSNTAIIQGRRRGEVLSYVSEHPFFDVEVLPLNDNTPTQDLEFEATVSSVRDLAKRIIELSPNIPSEAVMMLQNMKSDGFLINFIASNLDVDALQKQELLEMGNFKDKAVRILGLLNSQLQMLELKDKIEGKVRGDLEKQQRDYFLNQQLRTIQEELGGNPHEVELNEMEKRSKEKLWSKEAAAHFEKEIAKVRRMNPQAPEFSIGMNYLEVFLDLPWSKVSEDKMDLVNAKKILDKDHYGLNDVKERILEHLAVLKLKGDLKAPILCLVGPPGVGKTSLGKSIAKALDREFIRMSLGGLHDESEIRGHRKTYIGAMPGRIIKSLRKSKYGNPVFILDEIDKIGKDFRGDPSSALLEVLDPEQNNAFYDNYLETEYDLSKVMFIATANSLSSIQPALRDRMEIIEVTGYATEEKIEIAKKHLIPKQREMHGLTASDVTLSSKIIDLIISEYTRESGVRNLDRTIGSVMRNIAKRKAMEEIYTPKLDADEIHKILGPIIFSKDRYTKPGVPGVAVGLAWTSVGGDILFIEAIRSKGKGKLVLTGNLGEVMKESASTALSFMRAHATEYAIDPALFDESELHIHVPEGAIPKDGPSAGITMLSAIASVFTGKEIKPYMAMTGEITLRGKVLPVGGIKEKVLAAKRAGMKEVMLCVENRRHVEEIDQSYIKDMKFIYVDRMSEVLAHAIK